MRSEKLDRLLDAAAAEPGDTMTIVERIISTIVDGVLSILMRFALVIVDSAVHRRPLP